MESGTKLTYANCSDYHELYSEWTQQLDAVMAVTYLGARVNAEDPDPYVFLCANLIFLPIQVPILI